VTSSPSSTPTPVTPPPLTPYQYEAQTPSGESLRGTLEAPSPLAAQSKLAALNLRVLSVTPAPAAKKSRTPLSADDFLLFNQQLAHLTEAGLPIERGLRLIAQDLRSGKLSSAANAVAADLEKGLSLHDAFAQHERQFPPLYARLVDAGVQSGNLPAMLFTLGRHLELVTRLRQAIWRAVAYPIMALAALACVLLFISRVILPQFREIYTDFHTTLPTLTEAVLWIGSVYPMILVAVAIIILGALAAVLFFRFAGKQGVVTDYVFLRIPLIGRVLRASLLARWCDALRLSIEAGLDLPRAIMLASDATASPRLSQDGVRLSNIVGSGAPLGTFEGDLLPATIPAAIELSARTGDLPATLSTVTRMYEQQADNRLRLVPALLTPILMVVVAGAIGVTLTAMFLPLLRLIQSVSGGAD
jgi:type IV pilus assembly protein PilC